MFERLRRAGRGTERPDAAGKAGMAGRNGREATLMRLHWRGVDGAATHRHKALVAKALAHSRDWTNHLPLRPALEKYALISVRLPRALADAQAAFAPLGKAGNVTAPDPQAPDRPAPGANPCLTSPEVANGQPPKGDTTWDFSARG